MNASIAASEAPAPARSPTARAVRSRSRCTAHRASLARTSVALRASSSSAARRARRARARWPPSRSPRRWTRSSMATAAARSPSRVSTPGTPRSSRSTPSTSPAASCSAGSSTGSPVSRARSATSSSATIPLPSGGSRRLGRRTTPTIPHMADQVTGRDPGFGLPLGYSAGELHGGREVLGGPLGLLPRGRLHHHPHHRLGARRPHEDAALVAQLVLRLLGGAPEVAVGVELLRVGSPGPPAAPAASAARCRRAPTAAARCRRARRGAAHR